MRVCVDTTILLDILKDEFRSFQDKLYTALARKENLVAPPVVFAELMPQFKENTNLLGEFLEEHKIAIEPLGVDSAIAAAQVWMRYLKRKTKCSAILTRDRGIYTKYFPALVRYEDCLKASSR